jgi:hypothetical protein
VGGDQHLGAGDGNHRRRRRQLKRRGEVNRVTTGARSGLRHDPTDPAHPQAGVDLVQRVVRVSPAAQALIAALPPPA